MTRQSREALAKMARTLAEMQRVLDCMAERIAALEAKAAKGQQTTRPEARA